MNKVVFLDKGNIVLEGTHAELLQTSKRYQCLYEMDSWERL